MAYRTVIDVDVLSEQSVTDALRRMRFWKSLCETSKRDMFVSRLCDLMCERISGILAPYVATHTTVADGVEQISVHGKHVAFVEFGAGVTAGNGTHQPIGVNFYPGSWSIDHKKTYQTWVAGGMVGNYRYNITARHAFDRALDEMTMLAVQSANEIFGSGQP